MKSGSGHLVGISSIAGLRGSRLAPSYHATKAYQINYLEGLRHKARKLGSEIVITNIRPRFVDTAMAKGDGLFWVASAKKAADQISLALKNSKKVIYVTRRWQILALLIKMLPRSVYERLMSR